MRETDWLRLLDSTRRRCGAYGYTQFSSWAQRLQRYGRDSASPAPSSDRWPFAPARGAGAFTLVSNPPLTQPRPQDPDQAAENIRSWRSVRRPATGPTVGLGAELTRQVSELAWYHTIELPHGVVTPGTYDHRELVHHYGLPDSLAGRSALDIGTADGFWAFELERRGAAVVAADVPLFSDHDFPPEVRSEFLRRGIDGPTGTGFELARSALGSSVVRKEQSVYDLSEAELGQFDFVHIADVLLHLDRPLDALRRVRAVTRGQALIADAISPTMPPAGVEYVGNWGIITYWVPSLETLVQMVADAGFSSVRVHALYSLAVTHVADAIGPWRAILIAEP